MTTKPRPKKQHYVPRFYLANFTDSKGMVWSYDAQKNEVRSALPEETAVESNFYSVKNSDGEYNDQIEHWLQNVEDKAASLYPKILRGERLEGQEKADFSTFLGSLYARSPAIVTAYAEISGYMQQHITDITLANRERFELSMNKFDAERGNATTVKERDALFEYARDKSKYIVQVDKKLGLQALGVADAITRVFFDMTWVVFESRDQHLVTSDNPVIQVNPPEDYHPIYGDGGFLNKRSNVSVPLTPSKVLGLSWLTDVPRGVHRVDKQQGRLFNRQRAHFAERYLFASMRDHGIQALSQKYKSPGVRMGVSGMERLAPVEVKRGLTK